METMLKLDWQKATLEASVRYGTLPLLAPSADYAAANLYMWDETYHQELAFCGERAAGRILEEDGRYRYLFPVGTGPVAPILEAMLQEERERGGRLRFVGVAEAEMPALVAQWGEKLEILETREWEDYLYDAQKLATLSGKKLHGKRNHINAFCAAHDWYTVPLGRENLDTCMEILEKWRESKEEDTSEERRAIERGFEAPEALSLEGLLLYADGVPVAFTVGSRITSDCLCVHFEKAVPGVDGAYPMINREFVRAMLQNHPEITLVNREDDMGLPNLRAAKLSYHPVALLRKFDVTVMA